MRPLLALFKNLSWRPPTFNSQCCGKLMTLYLTTQHNFVSTAGNLISGKQKTIYFGSFMQDNFSCWSVFEFSFCCFWMLKQWQEKPSWFEVGGTNNDMFGRSEFDTRNRSVFWQKKLILYYLFVFFCLRFVQTAF